MRTAGSAAAAARGSTRASPRKQREADQDNAGGTAIRGWTKNSTLGKSFRYAFAGLATFAEQSPGHAAIVVFFTVASLLAGLLLRVSLLELTLVVVAILFVAVTEMLNTALEAIVDLVTPEYHDLAKAAKDMAAGAVLVSIFGAVVIGAVVFLPPLWRLIGL